MPSNVISDFFLYCTLINYGVLLFWFLMFCFAHDWLKNLHGRWFAMPVESFDAIHYQLMGGFKLLILVFNLTPYLIFRFTL